MSSARKFLIVEWMLKVEQNDAWEKLRYLD